VLASETNDLTASIDSLLNRLALLPYRPQYVSEFYLGERLSEFKLERLRAVLAAPDEANTLSGRCSRPPRPRRRAGASEADAKFAALLLRRPLAACSAGAVARLLHLDHAGAGKGEPDSSCSSRPEPSHCRWS
jgi:hypothetical protein